MKTLQQKPCTIKQLHDFIWSPCEFCHPELKGINERKAIWMAKATAHFDTPQIRKEAEEIFNEKNGLNALYNVK